MQDECVTTDPVRIHATETICTGVKTSQMQSWRTKSVLPGDAVLHLWDVSHQLEGMVHCPWALVHSASTNRQWTDRPSKVQIERVSPSKDSIAQSLYLTRGPARGRTSFLDLLVPRSTTCQRSRYCNRAGPEPTTTKADPGSKGSNARYCTRPHN